MSETKAIIGNGGSFSADNSPDVVDTNTVDIDTAKSIEVFADKPNHDVIHIQKNGVMPSEEYPYIYSSSLSDSGAGMIETGVHQEIDKNDNLKNSIARRFFGKNLAKIHPSTGGGTGTALYLFFLWIVKSLSIRSVLFIHSFSLAISKIKMGRRIVDILHHGTDPRHLHFVSYSTNNAINLKQLDEQATDAYKQLLVNNPVFMNSDRILLNQMSCLKIDHSEFCTDLINSILYHRLRKRFENGSAISNQEFTRSKNILENLLNELDTLQNQIGSSPKAEQFSKRNIDMSLIKGIINYELNSLKNLSDPILNKIYTIVCLLGLNVASIKLNAFLKYVTEQKQVTDSISALLPKIKKGIPWFTSKVTYEHLLSFIQPLIKTAYFQYIEQKVNGIFDSFNQPMPKNIRYEFNYESENIAQITEIAFNEKSEDIRFRKVAQYVDENIGSLLKEYILKNRHKLDHEFEIVNQFAKDNRMIVIRSNLNDIDKQITSSMLISSSNSKYLQWENDSTEIYHFIACTRFSDMPFFKEIINYYNEKLLDRNVDRNLFARTIAYCFHPPIYEGNACPFPEVTVLSFLKLYFIPDKMKLYCKGKNKFFMLKLGGTWKRYNTIEEFASNLPFDLNMDINDWFWISTYAKDPKSLSSNINSIVADNVNPSDSARLNNLKYFIRSKVLDERFKRLQEDDSCADSLNQKK